MSPISVKNVISTKKKKRERKQAQILHRNTEQSTCAKICDCFLGSNSWNEFTVGLSGVLTCYHHTVITFWPLFCSVNTLTTQPFAESQMLKNPNHLWSNIWEHIDISSPDSGESKAVLMCRLFWGKIKDVSWQVGSPDAKPDNSGITCRWIIAGKGLLQSNNGNVNAPRDSHVTQVVICQAPQSQSLAHMAECLG